MPYVTETRRQAIARGDIEGMGDLTYQLTMDLLDYLLMHGESYQTHGEILGALEGAKAEWIRRKLGPYEARKCQENGDVY